MLIVSAGSRVTNKKLELVRELKDSVYSIYDTVNFKSLVEENITDGGSMVVEARTILEMRRDLEEQMRDTGIMLINSTGENDENSDLNRGINNQTRSREYFFRPDIYSNTQEASDNPIVELRSPDGEQITLTASGFSNTSNTFQRYLSGEAGIRAFNEAFNNIIESNSGPIEQVVSEENTTIEPLSDEDIEILRKLQNDN